MVKLNDLVKKFHAVMRLREGDRSDVDILASLLKLFALLATQEEFVKAYPDFPLLFFKLSRNLEHGDPEIVEVALTQLYCYLHGKDSAYTPSEREEFEKYGGYWCHAGGLSPLLRAKPYITPETKLADYGAGNGLQGLLFQYLYPHQKTCQIELSAPMIEKGKRLQAFMGIPRDNVEWVHKNIIDVPPGPFNFIYLYRPVRPEGKGKAFYENIAASLDRVKHRVIIFSVADCLKDHLGGRFNIFYDDGHLTCFTNEPLNGEGAGAG
jgi:hypothetical protein